MSSADALNASLPAILRLALVYAPRRSREPFLGLFGLDTRLAGLIRGSSEPMLAQLRLAWWRESLERSSDEWPKGEPIFASLRSWNGHHAALQSLVDGWEALTAPPPLGPGAIAAFADGRGAACAALARAIGCDRDSEAARSLGQVWAIEDLAARLSRDDEKAAAVAMACQQPSKLPRTGRGLRPLRVVAGLARRRRIGGGDAAAASPSAVLDAIRLGLLGL